MPQLCLYMQAYHRDACDTCASLSRWKMIGLQFLCASPHFVQPIPSETDTLHI